MFTDNIFLILTLYVLLVFCMKALKRQPQRPQQGSSARDTGEMAQWVKRMRAQVWSCRIHVKAGSVHVCNPRAGKTEQKQVGPTGLVANKFSSVCSRFSERPHLRKYARTGYTQKTMHECAVLQTHTPTGNANHCVLTGPTRAVNRQPSLWGPFSLGFMTWN